MRLLWLWLGCGAGGDTGDSAQPIEDVEEGACSDPVTWEGWGEGFFASYCDACHSASTPDRYGAPEGLTFDTYEEVVVQAVVIESSVLVNETMPVGGGVTEEDRILLLRFLQCLP